MPLPLHAALTVHTRVRALASVGWAKAVLSAAISGCRAALSWSSLLALATSSAGTGVQHLNLHALLILVVRVVD